MGGGGGGLPHHPPFFRERFLKIISITTSPYPNIVTYPISPPKNQRHFACYPAVAIFIVSAREEILLLQSPKRKRWEVVSGTLETGETVLAGALREVVYESPAKERLEGFIAWVTRRVGR